MHIRIYISSVIICEMRSPTFFEILMSRDIDSNWNDLISELDFWGKFRILKMVFCHIYERIVWLFRMIIIINYQILNQYNIFIEYSSLFNFFLRILQDMKNDIYNNNLISHMHDEMKIRMYILPDEMSVHLILSNLPENFWFGWFTLL